MILCSASAKCPDNTTKCTNIISLISDDMLQLSSWNRESGCMYRFPNHERIPSEFLHPDISQPSQALLLSHVAHNRRAFGSDKPKYAHVDAKKTHKRVQKDVKHANVKTMRSLRYLWWLAKTSRLEWPNRQWHRAPFLFQYREWNNTFHILT